MVYAVSQMAEEHEALLEAEAEVFGLDVPAMLEFVNYSDPEAALALYRKANPDLDLSHKKLQAMLETDPYRLVVGVLRCMRPEPAASEAEDPQASMDGAQQDSSDDRRGGQSTNHANVVAQPPSAGPVASPKPSTTDFEAEKRRSREIAQEMVENLNANLKRKYLPN